MAYRLPPPAHRADPPGRRRGPHRGDRHRGARPARLPGAPAAQRNQRYDLVLDLGGEFLRVQCKTGRLRKGAIVFSARSCRSNRNGIYVRSYTDEADVFVVYCPETDRIYAVPVGESGVLKAASLRVTAPANGQTKGIRWAADHELPT